MDENSFESKSGTSDRDSWIGGWAMDHDGWRGTLTITGFIDLSYPPQNLFETILQAYYTAADGTASEVHGRLDQHHLSRNIAFPGNNQPFQLYLFNREIDNAAGTTVWNGTTFGVRLHKNARIFAQRGTILKS